MILALLAVLVAIFDPSFHPPFIFLPLYCSSPDASAAAGHEDPEAQARYFRRKEQGKAGGAAHQRERAARKRGLLP